MNYACKKKKLKLKIFKKDLKIVQIFIKLNLIKIIKNDLNSNSILITIYFVYLSGEPVFRSIKNLNKPSKMNIINYKQLSKFNKKNNSLFLMSTSKGLLTNFEAEKYRIGGNIILKIKI